jgi:hypothetical protein
MLVILCVAVRVCLPNILDFARYHADLSYTIEWGPTYWVENWMRDLGEPGIKLLCNTRADAPRHAVSGASTALWHVSDPKYFDLFAATYLTPSSPIKGCLVHGICSMYGNVKAASTPDVNVTKISAFLKQLINAKPTPNCERQIAMEALWGGNVDQLVSRKSMMIQLLPGEPSFCWQRRNLNAIWPHLPPFWAMSPRKMSFGNPWLPNGYKKIIEPSEGLRKRL